jgi:hypothetical protein
MADVRVQHDGMGVRLQLPVVEVIQTTARYYLDDKDDKN